MVRGYIIAERIRKPCRDSLQRRFTPRSGRLKQSSEKLDFAGRRARREYYQCLMCRCAVATLVHFHDYDMSNALFRR